MKKTIERKGKSVRISIESKTNSKNLKATMKVDSQGVNRVYVFVKRDDGIKSIALPLKSIKEFNKLGEMISELEKELISHKITIGTK